MDIESKVNDEISKFNSLNTMKNINSKSLSLFYKQLSQAFGFKLKKYNIYKSVEEFSPKRNDNSLDNQHRNMRTDGVD